MPVTFINSGRFASAPAGGSIIDPLTLSPLFYYDPSQSSTVTLNGSNVAQLDDLSTNARHATQGTATNQPLLQSAAINGLDCMYCAFNDYLTIPLFTQAQPVAIAAVVQFDNADANNRRFITHNGNSGPSMGTNSGNWIMFAGSTISGGTDDGTTHVFVGVFNNTSSSLRVDGSVVGGPAAGGTNGFGTNAHTIGCNAAVSLAWAGEIGSVIAWASPTTQQILDIEATFKDQWGTA